MSGTSAVEARTVDRGDRESSPPASVSKAGHWSLPVSFTRWSLLSSVYSSMPMDVKDHWEMKKPAMDALSLKKTPLVRMHLRLRAYNLQKSRICSNVKKNSD